MGMEILLIALAGLTGLATGAIMNAYTARLLATAPWHYRAAQIGVAVLFMIFAARVLWGVGIPSYVAPSGLFLLFVRDVLVSTFLVSIFLFDARASVIPDRLSLPAIAIVLLGNSALGMPVAFMLFGGLLIAAFFAFQTVASAGKWVGGGDVRVGFLMGALLGPWMGIAALVLSYMLGAAVGLYLLFFRRAKLTDHVPFGTFMVVATFVMMLWGSHILSWYFHLVPLT